MACKHCGALTYGSNDRCRGCAFKGEHNPQHKLRDADVLEIRNIVNMTQEAIARQFNVSRSLISLVQRRRAWTHV